MKYYKIWIIVIEFTVKYGEILRLNPAGRQAFEYAAELDACIGPYSPDILSGFNKCMRQSQLDPEERDFA